MAPVTAIAYYLGCEMDPVKVSLKFNLRAMLSRRHVIRAAIIQICLCGVAVLPAAASSWSQQRKPAASIQELRRAVRANPGSAEAHNALGLALGKGGQLDEAIAEFREAVRLQPDYGEAHSNLGVGLEQRGDVEGAVAAFRRAAEVSPGDAEIRVSLGSLLLRKQDSGRGDYRIKGGRAARPRLCRDPQ